MLIKNESEYKDRYSKAKTNAQTYWKEIAREYQWQKPFSKICEGSFSKAETNIKWFADGELNITENCLDRHVQTHPDQVAIIFEPNNPESPNEKITYKQLLERVCQFSNLLKEKGVKKGDVVCFYMSMVPELLVGVLACARIGAIHSVVFGGFSAEALGYRIEDCKSKLLVTCDQTNRGDKVIPLQRIARKAVESVSFEVSCWVLGTPGSELDLNPRELDLRACLSTHDTTCVPEVMNAEDPLFILYTSGSTGKPKGLMHTTAGYMVWAGETFKQVFQYKPNDIFWCTADIGWITGHSYITYGPLLNRATQVFFEGVPTWPTPGRFWDVVDKHKVTHFYTAPTAIRALEACGEKYVADADLSSLKVLGSVGEPINQEAWDWYYEKVGKSKTPIVDTWWQTETGGVMISNMAGVTPAKPCYATKPLPGVELAILGADRKEVAGEEEGFLVVKKPWPGIARTVWGDHSRYLETYFSKYDGYYFTGDAAKRDSIGDYRIIGRTDDVINVSGHRIGTAEVENAINEHAGIFESAVVGKPHDIKGQGLCAFAITEKNINEIGLLKEVNQIITEKIGPIGKLDHLYVVSGLPKTRSGKIMRRILRKVVNGSRDYGDISTLLNPECVKEIELKCL